MYIHERKEWPEFKWDQIKMAPLLADVRHLQGRLLGRMEGLGFQLREEATLQTLTRDVVKTSEIEGEKLDEHQVRSSLARRMGMDTGALPPIDRNVEGIVEVMLDATRNHGAPFTQERLFSWQCRSRTAVGQIAGANSPSNSRRSRLGFRPCPKANHTHDWRTRRSNAEWRRADA